MVDASSRHVHISDLAKPIVAALDDERYAEFLDAITRLAEDPAPDGVRRIEIKGFPYRDGVVVCNYNGFFITYLIADDDGIHISYVEDRRSTAG